MFSRPVCCLQAFRQGERECGFSIGVCHKGSVLYRVAVEGDGEFAVMISDWRVVQVAHGEAGGYVIAGAIAFSFKIKLHEHAWRNDILNGKRFGKQGAVLFIPHPAGIGLYFEDASGCLLTEGI